METTKSSYMANTTPSPLAANLLDQKGQREQFLREVEKMRNEYEGNYKASRKAFNEEACSMSKVDMNHFTEIINLPKDKWRTVSDVLKAKHYLLEKKVGKGGYGVVYKARFQTKQTSDIVACKVISFNKGARRKLLRNLLSEVFVMSRYPHPNIILLLDHFVIDDKAVVVMEYADAGSLNDCLEKNGTMCESAAFEYFIQILKGLFYLHTFRIAHR